MKHVRGYNFSRPFFGERVPQHVQNIVIKDFCNKNKLNFLLSATEYSMKESSHIINELVNDIDNLYGIVAYSLFQLPSDKKIRKKILNKILIKRKKIFFACENLQVTNRAEMFKIETLWKIKEVSESINYDRIYKNKI